MNQLVINPNEVARLAMESPIQRKVEIVAQAMKQMPQMDCPLTHEFVRLFYIRTICVPAGTLVVSKIFKADFPFFIVKGKVTTWTEHEGIQELEAPYWGHTKAGSRRFVMHHTDVTWTTIHPNPNNLRDIQQLEAEILYQPEETK